jgi:hypothetical protein
VADYTAKRIEDRIEGVIIDYLAEEYRRATRSRHYERSPYRGDPTQ